MASAEPIDRAAARQALGALRQLQRETVELREVRRVDALERVREAVRRIGEVGSPEGILDRAAEELGESSEFGRVLISQVRDAAMVPHGLWMPDAPAAAAGLLAELRRHPLPLEYPLIEAEVARHQRAIAVVVAASGSRSPRALSEALAWDSYVVAALTLHGTTIGLLHADASLTGRALEALDQEVASVYADGLAGAFERAALRKQLGQHRDELRAAVQWMVNRVESTADDEVMGVPARRAARANTDALTRREAEVLQLLGRGHTNASIATTLVISDSTVKFHVKNILRKLHATSRADAVARYLRGAG